MGQETDNTALVKEAEDFLAAAKSFDGNYLKRIDLTRRANNLRWLSEDAGGTLFRQWDTMHLTAALRTLVQCGIFDKIPKDGGSIGSKELAEAAGIDESVVQRSLGITCTQGIAEEVAPDTYAHNAKSLTYIQGNGKYFFQFLMDYVDVYQKLPEYFKTHPVGAMYEPRKSPYAWAHGMKDTTYYEAISASPERFETFNKAMAQFEDLVPTLGMYPFSSLKEKVEAEPDRPLIVDVGGSYGHCLMSIQEEAPAGFGAPIILQDRPDVIDEIAQESIPNITKMAHDFFTPQPIKNAHLYFLRRVMHNFNDEDCKTMLSQIAVAMGPTSRLLIGEFILPEQAQIGDDFTIRWMDFCMITLTGKERTEKQFVELLDAAGLDLVKVWPFIGPGQPQSIIETKLKGS